MSHLQINFNEILSICEDILNSGDYLTISNNLQEIYKCVCVPHHVIPVHLIRKLKNVIPEDEQEERGISFYLTEDEQKLVMIYRYTCFYNERIFDTIDAIQRLEREIETVTLNKQAKLRELKRFRENSPDQKQQLRSLNTEHKTLIQELRHLRYQKSTYKKILPQLRESLENIRTA